jgi:preprotein translocase subunit YajC
MERWKLAITSLVIINFIITLIIFCYLIISPNNRCDLNCGNNTTGITGVVTKIDKRDDGVTILVESNDGVSTYDKAYVTVNNY